MACEISQMCGGIKGVGWGVVDCGVWGEFGGEWVAGM